MCPPTHPWVKKRHLLTHKITASANYTDCIGTGYMSHNKEICLHGKRLKNNFKINQSAQACTDAVMKRTRERGKNAVVFPTKTSYKLGTDEKRGKQVGFLYLGEPQTTCKCIKFKKVSNRPTQIPILLADLRKILLLQSKVLADEQADRETLVAKLTEIKGLNSLVFTQVPLQQLCIFE